MVTRSEPDYAWDFCGGHLAIDFTNTVRRRVVRVALRGRHAQRHAPLVRHEGVREPQQGTAVPRRAALSDASGDLRCHAPLKRSLADYGSLTRRSLNINLIKPYIDFIK